jgi:hypothetical protein
LASRSIAFAFLLTIGCSSSGDPVATSGSGGSPSPGTGGSGGSAATLAYKPCALSQRVGGFAVQLVAANPSNDPPAAAYTQVNGGVIDRVDPATLWPTDSSEGDCQLVVGPSLVCSPACGTGQVCAGQGKCTPEPVSQSVGNVSLTGLGAPLTIMPLNSYKVVYYAALPATAPYPPFAAEAELKLAAEGGSYGAFTLSGRGIEPLVFAGIGLKVGSAGEPLAVTWTAPVKARSARVNITLDVGHHGGYAARVECDVADTGAATIPGALLAKLIARGTAGFPTITLTRHTVDSTSIAPGCVDFTVASSVERSVDVDKVVSCNEDHPCPSGRTCGADQKCQ